MPLYIRRLHDATSCEEFLVTMATDVLVNAGKAPSRCGTNDVADISIDIWEDGYLAAEQVAPCDDSESRLTGLPGGDYLVDVAALDDNGEAWFTGTAEVNLEKGDQGDLEVRLDAIAGKSRD